MQIDAHTEIHMLGDGDGVGLSVGASVGAAVGATVGFIVGLAVGNAVGAAPSISGDHDGAVYPYAAATLKLQSVGLTLQ